VIKLLLDGSCYGGYVVDKRGCYPQAVFSTTCAQCFTPVSRWVVHRAQKAKPDVMEKKIQTNTTLPTLQWLWNIS